MSESEKLEQALLSEIFRRIEEKNPVHLKIFDVEELYNGPKMSDLQKVWLLFAKQLEERASSSVLDFRFFENQPYFVIRTLPQKTSTNKVESEFIVLDNAGSLFKLRQTVTFDLERHDAYPPKYQKTPLTVEQADLTFAKIATLIIKVTEGQTLERNFQSDELILF